MSEPISDDKKNAFRQAEYDKAFETYRTQIVTIIQIVSGFVALNATILGIGLTVQKAWLFLVGALISLVTAFVILSGERASRPFLMRAIQLELDYGDKDSSVTSLWAALLYGVDGLRKFQDIAQTERVEEKLDGLNNVTSRINSSRFLLLVYSAVITQIVLAVILPLIFSWSFI